MICLDDYHTNDRAGRKAISGTLGSQCMVEIELCSMCEVDWLLAYLNSRAAPLTFTSLVASALYGACSCTVDPSFSDVD